MSFPTWSPMTLSAAGAGGRKAHHCPAEMQVPPMDLPGHGAGSLSSELCFCGWGWGYIFYVVFGDYSSDCKFSDLLPCCFPGPLLKECFFSPVLLVFPDCWLIQYPAWNIHCKQTNKSPKNPEYLLLYHFWRFKYSSWSVLPPPFTIFLIFFV